MLWTSFFRSVEGRADVLFSPHPLEETRSELFWGETGLKIRQTCFVTTIVNIFSLYKL